MFQMIGDAHSFRKGLMMQKKGISLLAVFFVLAGLPGCNSIFSSTSASHVIYVTVPNTGVAAFRINNSTGGSTSILGSPYATGNSPFSIQVDPAKKFAYVSNSADNTISLFKIDSSSGALTEVMPRTPTGLSPQSLSMDSAGTVLFVSNNGSNNISAYSIDSSSGVLTEISGSPFATNTNPNFLTVSPTGKFVYVLITNLGLVAAYTNTSGVLQPVVGSPFPVGTGPFALAIDPGEKFMYVTNAGTGSTITGMVTGYTINSTTGALTLIQDSAFPTGTNPVSALVHPTGNFLYVANSGSDNVSQFSINSTTGQLTELDTATVSAGTTPVFIAFDPISGFVDVGNQGSDNVTEFTVNLFPKELDYGILGATNTVITIDPPTSIAFGK
jgi:6-phosphogluconolactonase